MHSLLEYTPIGNYFYRKELCNLRSGIGGHHFNFSNCFIHARPDNSTVLNQGKTRMHSSRMRTAHPLTVVGGGGCCPPSPGGGREEGVVQLVRGGGGGCCPPGPGGLLWPCPRGRGVLWPCPGGCCAHVPGGGGVLSTWSRGEGGVVAMSRGGGGGCCDHVPWRGGGVVTMSRGDGGVVHLVPGGGGRCCPEAFGVPSPPPRSVTEWQTPVKT